MDSPPPHTGQEPRSVVPASPARFFTLPRVFSTLLIVAAATSVLSTLAFIAYLLLPALAHAHGRTQFAYLYAAGIGGLAVAEGCQILGVLVLIRQWLSRINVEKKPRELAVLLVSLIPYMVVVIFLITLVVYLRARRLDRASERTREAAQELKEQVVDTLIDAGANTTNTAAGSPGPSTAAAAAAPHHAARRTMQDAVRQVVGPATGKSVSEAAHGAVAVTMIALVLSAAATAGVVVPSRGLAPLQSAASAASPAPSPTPTSLAGTWTFVFANCAYSQTQPTAASGSCASQGDTGTDPGAIQQSGNRLALTLGGILTGVRQTDSYKRTGTLSGRNLSLSITLSFEAGSACTEQWIGSVLDASRLGGTYTDKCTGSITDYSAKADWTATRNAP